MLKTMSLPFRVLENPRSLSSGQIEEAQRILAAAVRVEGLHGPVLTVCGVDCAYSPDDSRVHAAAVLLSVTDFSVLSCAHVERECVFPYVPGLLGFRETAVSIQAVRALRSAPDLVLCDGHGVAHPCGCGLACCIGLWLDIPTIGVAKAWLYGIFEEPGVSRGDWSPLMAPTLTEGRERIIGTVVRTRSGSKPLFVSPGHRISHDEAAQWVLATTTRSRTPEPLSIAHQEANSGIR
jgi:deoxyribonuclease V